VGQPLNVVHRDVSPQNVLVGSDGLARVMDFGIAKAADQLHMTRPGEVRGKASYMAPEQALGQKVDRRTDVYAAAIVLFESLTLQRPFTGANFAELALKQLHDPPPRPSRLRSAVPPELEEIILRALAKEPEARFATAREMREALEALGLRVTRHDLGAWLTDAQRDFLEGREKLVAGISVEESTGPAAESPPEIPTRTTVTGPEPQLDDEVEPTAAPARWPKRLLAALGAVAVVTTLAVLAVQQLRSRQSAPSAPSTQPGPAVPTSPSSAPLVTATPDTSVVLPLASVVPSVTASRVHATSTRGTSTTATVVVTTTVTAPPPMPDCCTGNIRINVGHCRDNCPPGT
jgi:eukaryotic-like serine/threonine-protein kinase